MRKIDICPMILDTMMVAYLPVEVLNEFVEMSNATIVQHVESFNLKHAYDEDADIRAVVEKLKKIYEPYYAYQAFVNGPELSSAFKLIVTQNKADISYDMSKSDLVKIRDTCRNVLQYEDMLKRYDEKSYLTHLDNISKFCNDTDDANLSSLGLTLVSRCKKFRKVFINAKGREDDKSVLYRIFRFKDKAKQLAEAAEGCLTRMEGSKENVTFDKRKWRHI